MFPTHRSRALMALGVSFTLLASACTDDDTVVSDDGDTNTPAAAEAFPVTVGDLTFDAAPTAIVSLSPTSTEVLFAIGAGDAVVAIDDQSDFPAEALDLPHDLSGYTPNVEAIAAHEPDLVVAGFDDGTLAAGLEKIGVPFLLHGAPATFDDAYGQIADLGIITGHVDEAAALVDQMRTDIAAIVASTAGADLSYFHELDDTLYSVTSTTFIGQVYGLFGLTNIADAADEAGSGYPQVTNEYVIDSDPDLIFLADAECCGQNAQTLAERPGWDQLRAITKGGVVELDEDIASRWGPRLVDFVQLVADAVTALQTADAAA